MKKAIEDIAVGALVTGIASYVLTQIPTRRKQIPSPDGLTEEAILRRLEGKSDRAFDWAFWNSSMGWGDAEAVGL